MNKQALVALSAVIMLLAFVVGSMLFRAERADELSTLAEDSSSTLAPAHAMTLGPDDARVQIVEFFDPACETCATFYKPVKELMAMHPGRIQLVHRYLPLHPGSDQVVKMLEASRKQGKYWEALEIMFASQKLWASHHAPQPERLWDLLPQVGVDVKQVQANMGDFTLDGLIHQEMADAATLGIRKTPGFLVNGKPLPSFGFPQLQALVEAEIAANY